MNLTHVEVTFNTISVAATLGPELDGLSIGDIRTWADDIIARSLGVITHRYVRVENGPVQVIFAVPTKYEKVDGYTPLTNDARKILEQLFEGASFTS